MISIEDVKRELGRRVSAVTQPQFVESRIRPCLGAERGANGRYETQVLQLDGTGAATVEFAFGESDKVFAKLYPNENGRPIYEKLQALRAAGFGPDSRYQAVEPLGFISEYG